MIRIELAGQSERRSAENPYPREFTGGSWPLRHQVRTAAAAEADIVINTHNTGTGKTRAALLRLLEAARADGHNRRNCLLIAPTNELLRQHKDDAQRFVERNGMPHQVIGIDAQTVRELELPELHRQGDKLNTVLLNPRLISGADTKKPMIVVVNPDIFYCALYFLYGSLDQRNLFHTFLTMFDTVIVDEFHHYNAKQLANFLYFITLCKEMEYFEPGPTKRQIILLSATPNEMVRKRLEQLEHDGLRLSRIAPEDEAVADGHETVPALAPLAVELIPYSAYKGDQKTGIAGLVAARRGEIAGWVGAGEHGAIISDALWRINAAYADLRGLLGERVGRLTGAETRQSRAAATTCDLLLATPTVDIGYNFERVDKEWQSLDFLLFEARNADQFLQRLGRAGRVLGKRVVDRPSRVIAIVPDALVQAVAGYEGQTLNRTAFAGLVRQALQPQHSLERYISYCAINETFLSIYRQEQMGGAAARAGLEALFDAVYGLYAPQGRRSYAQLRRQTGHLLEHQQIYRNDPQKSPERKLREKFIHELRPSGVTPEMWADIDRCLDAPALYEMGRTFQQWKRDDRCALSVEEAQFSFRDCLQLPMVLTYDPEHLLADADVTRYELLHVVRNYEASYTTDRVAWLREQGLDGATIAEAPFYARLQQRRPVRPRLYFQLRVEQTRQQWEDTHCNRITAVLGLELRLEGTTAPAAVLEALAQTPVVCLLVRDGHDDECTGAGQRAWEGALIACCAREGYVPHNLCIDWREGQQTYVLVMGTPALLVEAEMHGRLQAAVKATDRAVIC